MEAAVPGPALSSHPISGPVGAGWPSGNQLHDPQAAEQVPDWTASTPCSGRPATTCWCPVGEPPSTSSGSSALASRPTAATAALPAHELATSGMVLGTPANGHLAGWSQGLHPAPPSPIISRVQGAQALLVSRVCRCSRGPARGSVAVAARADCMAGPGLPSGAAPAARGGTRAARGRRLPGLHFEVCRRWNVLGASLFVVLL